MILLPGITHPSSRTRPAAPTELLALVNNPSKAPSGSHQRHGEGDKDSWTGDSGDYGDIFGDYITKKGKNTLRIGFQNIGGFPIDRGKHKEGIIRKGLTKWEFDVFGFVETNVDWRIVPEEDKLFFRTKGWWDSLHLSWTHNITQKTYHGETIWRHCSLQYRPSFTPGGREGS